MVEAITWFREAIHKVLELFFIGVLLFYLMLLELGLWVSGKVR